MLVKLDSWQMGPLIRDVAQYQSFSFCKRLPSHWSREACTLVWLFLVMLYMAKYTEKWLLKAP